MRLISLTVENFRGIKGEVSVLLKDSNIVFLIGPNNSGKSSFLEAYSAFVTSKRKAELKDFHGNRVAEPIILTGVFEEEESDKNAFSKKSLDKWVDADGTLKLRKVWKEEGYGEKETYCPKQQKFVPNGFGGFDSHLQRHAPTAIYIPAMPKQSELDGWLTGLLKNVTLKSLDEKERTEFESSLERLKDLQSRILGRKTLANLEKEVNGTFSEVFQNLIMTIEPLGAANEAILKAIQQDIKVTIKSEEGDTLPVELHGHGVIRQAMFHGVAMTRAHLGSQQGTETTGKDFMLLVEEPELYLHPGATQRFREALYKLCDSSPFQMLCATHNPQLIDVSKPHVSLARMSRSDSNSQVRQLQENVFGGNEDRRNQVLMINRFNPHVCEAFYSDFVLMSHPGMLEIPRL